MHFDLAHGEDTLGSSGEHLDALSPGWDSVDCWFRADGEAAVDDLESGPPLHSESILPVAVGARSRDAPDASEHELANCEVPVAGVQLAPSRECHSRCARDAREDGLANNVLVAEDVVQTPPPLVSHCTLVITISCHGRT